MSKLKSRDRKRNQIAAGSTTMLNVSEILLTHPSSPSPSSVLTATLAHHHVHLYILPRSLRGCRGTAPALCHRLASI
jgi:hypothetical protein